MAATGQQSVHTSERGCSFRSGSVEVTFAVLSYAGTLTITVTVDIGSIPDAGILIGALRQELDALGQDGPIGPGWGTISPSGERACDANLTPWPHTASGPWRGEQDAAWKVD
jgi:hypothetical protein